MSKIQLEDIVVEFPIYNMSSRSFKKAVLNIGTGGKISNDSRNRVVIQSLRHINLELNDGDRVGLIGHNGSGKTTLLRVLAGIYEPVQGRIHIEGRITPLLESSLGMDPDVNGYENIFLRGLYLGLDLAKLNDNIEEIAEFTELGDYLSMPIRTYSAGMQLRLAFGVATSLAPEILLLDEWFGAGDAHFLEKAQKRFEGFADQSKIIVLATHSVEIINRMCNKVVLLDKGELKAIGSPSEILPMYMNNL